MANSPGDLRGFEAAYLLSPNLIHSIAAATLAHPPAHAIIYRPGAFAALFVGSGTILTEPTIRIGLDTSLLCLSSFFFAVFVVIATAQPRGNAPAQMQKKVPKPLMTSLGMFPPLRCSRDDIWRK